MNKKGLELAISTIILIIIGIVVLIGLILLIRKGFSFFDESTDPFVNAESNAVVKQACELACNADDKSTFCCTNFKVNENNVSCRDNSLNVNCELDCSEFICN